MHVARLLVPLLVAACCEPTAVLDTFPVPVDLDSGVPILGARAGELAGEAVRVVLDTSAPVTVLDQGEEGSSRRRLELEVLRSPLAPPVARARFQCVPALIAGVGAVGAGSSTDVSGVIGGDILARTALRLDPSHGELRFFPGIAGSDSSHEESCSAVIRVTLAGGGSFIAGNDAVDFEPTRIVLPACLSASSDLGPTESGVDTLLVVATGVGPTVLSRTTARAALAVDDATIDALPTTRLYLPGDTQLFGEIAHVTRLPRMALTGIGSGEGPCDELHRSRSVASGAGGATCQGSTCAAAAVELSSEIEVAIVADTHPLLQGLRNELRPEVADIGGLLGMRALGPLVVDLDYPSSRVLIRCAAGATGCAARPRVSNAERADVLRAAGCL